MRNRAGKDENVPNRMVIRQVPPKIKHHAQRIQHAAQYEPNKSANRKIVYQRLNQYQAEPAHHEIGNRRNVFGLLLPEQFEQYPEQGHPPDRAENGPRQDRIGLPKDNQAKRRVRSGNHNVDCHFVDGLEDFLHSVIRYGMVEGRCRIKNDDSGTENGASNDFPWDLHIAPDREQHEENDRGGTEIPADGVRYCTDNFFREVVFGLFAVLF